MLKIYDQTSPLTFPNGRTYSVEELKSSISYKEIFFQTTVIEENEGIVSSFVPLEMLKSNLGVTNPDPQSALQECEAKILERQEQNKEDQKTIEDISAQADENTLALAELGSMAAESISSDADLLQAVGELGVQLAELSAKVDALQTPSA